ncbi:MAG TPA: hypothetical protein VJ249_10795 [Candidatus Bathyarchaeia archaeon]|nr:hypothetical protein [Candidatus Bathyarchaeia archaeon]
MKELKLIEDLACRILRDDCDPVVRFRLLRDVLKVSRGSGELVDARRGMLRSRWVLELKGEQRADGSWGRFHSAMKSKGKIVTTEAAVERGLALGLGASDSVLCATVGYLSRLLEGSVDFPDPAERNSRWATGTQLFASSTFARICPTLAILDEPWDLWAEIAERTFTSGKYDAEAEIRAHQMLTGASVKDSYLVLNNRYQLALLGSRASKLLKSLEKALVDWVWHKEDGVGYLEIPLSNLPQRFTAGMLDRLFTSLETLSYFPSWRKHAGNVIDWLWTNRNKEGLWDFGPRASMSVHLPLSESWRKSKKRQHDWSTRVLALLRNYYGA